MKKGASARRAFLVSGVRSGAAARPFLKKHTSRGVFYAAYFIIEKYGCRHQTVEPVNNFRWILTSFYSSGGGRYLMGMGPDVVVAPDGSMSPVHSMSGIAGFEYRFRPSSQTYAYYSGAWFSRNYIPVDSGGYLGFGYPGSSASANRRIREATFGYAHSFWKSPDYGSFRALGQYAYVTRSPWHAAPGSDPDMHVHMIFAGLRFTLP